MSTPPNHRSAHDPDALMRGLPPPSANERAHSAALAQHIRAEIRSHGGAIDFSRFMELALYAPALGYYSSGKSKFGAAGNGGPATTPLTGADAAGDVPGSTNSGARGDVQGGTSLGPRGSALGPHETSDCAAGDFITAPELGSVFAYCLARQCRQVLKHMGGGAILEAGAGSGVLAAQLLRQLELLGVLPDRYFILELSGELRVRQTATITRLAPDLVERVQWLDTLPAFGFRGIVLGNEVLDAMPTERFRVVKDEIEQYGVEWRDAAFVWKTRPADLSVRQRVRALGLPSDYLSEINFQAQAWIRSVADTLEQGAIFLVDYGFPRAEYYHPRRREGTLMCHYRHHAHGDPLILVGLQDITAHVDFTSVAETAIEAGLDLLGYTGQAAFLIGNGIEELIAASDPNRIREHLALTGQIKKLTLPQEMGELFKVIALGRGVEIPLTGFALNDRRGQL